MKELLEIKGFMKSLITFVMLAMMGFFCVYGALTGNFNVVFEFFKTQFAVIVAFFFGTQYAKGASNAG